MNIIYGCKGCVHLTGGVYCDNPLVMMTQETESIKVQTIHIALARLPFMGACGIEGKYFMAKEDVEKLVMVEVNGNNN